MTVRRIIALVMFCAALLFGAADLWHAYVPAANFGSATITMERLWLLVSARSMAITSDLLQRLWSPIWDIGVQPILLTPAWSFFGVVGLLFFIFGRPKVQDR